MALSSSAEYSMFLTVFREAASSWKPLVVAGPSCKAAFESDGNLGWPRASSPAYAFVRRKISRDFL